MFAKLNEETAIVKAYRRTQTQEIAVFTLIASFREEEHETTILCSLMLVFDQHLLDRDELVAHKKDSSTGWRRFI